MLTLTLRFEWTGTSLCLEGTKIWRFIAPPGASSSSLSQKDGNLESGVFQVDRALQSYRLPSTAWDDEIYLSSGWQSDMSLYAEISDDVPSAEELAMLEEEDGEDHKLSLIHDTASNLYSLAPSSDIPDTLCGNYDSGDSSSTPLPLDVWTVVQKPGDLLVIPAYWWHQTYAMEPSIAIASQRCGSERDASRVVKHVLETMGNDIDECSSSKSAVERFKHLCDWLSTHKHE